LVSKSMIKDFNPDWTLHLGDIYYAGLAEEVKSNCLGMPTSNSKVGVFWPHGAIGSLAIMGNHEMISRAWGFFSHYLPVLGSASESPSVTMKNAQEEVRKDGYKGPMLSGQDAAYWSLESPHWRIIGLDTGYTSWTPLVNGNNASLPLQLVHWLRDVVKIGDPSDKRGIILLSHHQPMSAFQKISTHNANAQIAKLLPPGRTFIWLFGHEHRFSVYNQFTLHPHDNPNLGLNFYGRCIGNGGFPSAIEVPPKHPDVKYLNTYDDRLYAHVRGLKTLKVGFQGYVRSIIKGNSIQLQYFTPDLDKTTKRLSDEVAPTLLMDETFVVDEKGNVEQSKFTAGHELTNIKH